MGIKHWAKTSAFVIAVTVSLGAAGCAPHSSVNLEVTDEIYGQLNSFPIRIRLDLSDDYRKTTKTDNKLDSSFGPDLVRYATSLAESMFVLVTDPNEPIDAVLTPTVVNIDHQMKMWAGQPAQMAITHQWTLTSTAGDIIWLETITGVGEMEMGTAFSEKERRQERVLLAIDNLFAESARQISSAVEIGSFSKQILATSKR